MFSSISFSIYQLQGRLKLVETRESTLDSAFTHAEEGADNMKDFIFEVTMEVMTRLEAKFLRLLHKTVPMRLAFSSHVQKWFGETKFNLYFFAVDSLMMMGH